MSERKKIRLVGLLVVSVCVVLAVAVVVGGPRSSAAASPAPQAPTTNFDASAPYPSVLPVYFVSGTPYEMGYQYGQEAKDEIVHNTCVARASALQTYRTWAAVVAAMQDGAARVVAKTPDVPEIWHGIADGAGLSYEEIVLLNVALSQAPACSTISVWGGATKDHQLIAGSNGDTGWLAGGMQGCVLVAYPDSGNSFISSTPQCGAWDGIRSMNDKGLVLMMQRRSGCPGRGHGAGSSHA